ncbi:MAG: RidA family protein [Candidatus Nitrosopelagicus sp.]|jgi:enamine deaminase RidA (YjgF/YER057c/UK114 family)|nr:RidA family protein [Candidatus Nitrosopelagicus sp.]MBT6646580.1 RidA family protein [Nitrososphaerota archaeon]MBT3762134.1 RidA family protein [Candidatus Nitrosopelagicus sp.]MBT4325407.1 RidA family protein [Candidatus Nitrosopelagicus sp.]MBT4455069.1 RidA family protein [Candidatus Nitrosopelagicus sp.]|tara:strand:- start:1101 stop:1559 length:459 start_codon:yes stop_codon:yes gene_type:complete
MIEDRLKELSIEIPTPPNPAGSYIPVVTTGNLAFVSGQIPMKDGKVIVEGKVPEKQSLDSAREAAKICIINGLAQLKSNLGSLDKITKFVRISGFVNSSQDFTEQPKVINAASDLLVEIFGDMAKHSRIAVGVASLPLNSTVEIDMIVEYSS